MASGELFGRVLVFIASSFTERTIPTIHQCLKECSNNEAMESNGRIAKHCYQPQGSRGVLLVTITFERLRRVM